MTSVDALGVDFESHNDLGAIAAISPWSRPPPDNNRIMVVEVISFFPCDHVEVLIAQLKTCCVIFATAIDRDEGGGSGEVVEDPFGDIAAFDQLLRPLHLFPPDDSIAQVLTLNILAHVDFQVGSFNSVASENFSKVERHAVTTCDGGTMMLVSRRRTHKRQVEVSVLKLAVVGIDLVHEQGDVLIGLIASY